MKAASKIRRGVAAVFFIATVGLLVVWQPFSLSSSNKTFSNVANTMSNVGGGYATTYYHEAKPENNSDNLWCLAIGFSFGIFVTLLATELLNKFEQACNDLAVLRMKYEALCRERRATESPLAAESRGELACAGK